MSSPKKARKAMETRRFGKTDWQISAIGMAGAQFHPTEFSQDNLDAVSHYLDLGGNFIDTTDVYGGAHFESVVKVGIDLWREKQRKKGGDADRKIYVVTRPGSGDTHAHRDDSRYLLENLRKRVDASRERLGVETLDLAQLFCPPDNVLKGGAVFDAMRTLVKEGRIQHWGVQVDTIAQAILCAKVPDCASVKIIFNCFRQKPAETFLKVAKENDVGVIARVPLANGLLTGKFCEATIAALDKDDHRVKNASGDHFCKGETWSGLGEHLKDAALPAVEGLKKLVPAGHSMTAFALRWILMHPEVSTLVSSMKRQPYVDENMKTFDVPQLDAETMGKVASIYDTHVRKIVYNIW